MLLTMSLKMDEISLLRQMPFYNLTNFQLSLVYELARVKYTDMLVNNSIQKHLINNVPQQMLSTFQCNYHDEESFNKMANSRKLALSLIHINLGSSIRNYSLFKAHLTNLLVKYDVIAISEAGVKNIEIARNVFQGYQFYYKEPTHKTTKGGTAIFIKSEIEGVSIRTDLELKLSLVEDIWLEINNLIIGVIYRHPTSNLNIFVQALDNSLDNIIKENKLTVVCGDININLLQQNSLHVKQYTDTLLSHNFMPMITLPTRITDHSVTLLDHINVFKPVKEIDRVTECGNLFFDISDHLPNFILIEGKHEKKVERPYIRIFSEKNISRFKNKISEINWQEVLTCEDTNSASDIFINQYASVFKQCFPLVKKSKRRCKDKKWITCALRVSIRHKTRLYRKYINRPNAANKAAYTIYKNKLVNVINKAKNLIILTNLHQTKLMCSKYGKYMQKYSDVTKKVTQTVYPN